jgi:hypothetical protein
MSDPTIASVQKLIQEREAELAQLKTQLDHLKTEAPEFQLARELHSVACTHNHTDGCSWFYEIHKGIDNWHEYAHSEWLKRSRFINNICQKEKIPPSKAIEIYKLIRGY